MIAREARTNFCDHAYFVLNHAHFCTIEAAILMMTNCRSSRIHLAAIEAHFTHIIRPGKKSVL